MKKLFLILAAAMLLSACSDDGDSNSSGSSGAAGSLQVVMKLSTDVGDSLVLRGTLSGSETDSVHESFSSNTTTASFEQLAAGTWNFEALLYDEGEVVQEGEGTVEIVDGEDASLAISLSALYGYVKVEVYLGLGNQIGVASGTIEFVDSTGESVSYELEVGDPYAYFNCGPLALGTYSVTITLYTSDGTAYLTYSTTITLSADNSAISWSLTSSDSEEGSSSSSEDSGDSSDESALSVSLTLAENDTLSVSAVVSTGSSVTLNSLDSETLAASYKGKVLISEVYVANSSGYRFLEFFNGTLESISLDGCVVRDSSSNKDSLSGIEIAPGGYYAIGGANSAASDNTLNDVVLPSQASKTVLITCNGVVIDSVFFTYVSSSKNESELADSIKVYNKTSTHLIISEWKEHLSSSAWCNSSTSTPGAAAPEDCSASSSSEE